MILAQKLIQPVDLQLQLEAWVHERLVAYAATFDSDPNYIAKEILRDYLATKGAKRNGKEKKGKKT